MGLTYSGMKYWLMKSEPDECSIDDVLALPKRTTAWSGVRNYQARNFMLNDMSVGDGVLFYHSSCPEPGIAGLAEVAVDALAVPTDFRDFDDYWQPFLGAAGPAPAYVAALPEERRHALAERLRAALPVVADGTIPLSATAWVAHGRVSGPG